MKGQRQEGGDNETYHEAESTESVFSNGAKWKKANL